MAPGNRRISGYPTPSSVPSASHALHPNFLPITWQDILQQAELTLNTLHAFDPDPIMLACDGLYGKKFDFGKHRIVLPLPALSGECRYFEVYAIKIGHQRVSDTLAWFPAALRPPGSSPKNCISLH